ncbi:MAG: radical SAM family heme chaperone HemW [Clostridia bacterium]|nr:radical SAM family heme chaperone HemW [Clostridia bacterium]
MELYIHIPYCKQKCRYCDFPSYPCLEHTMPQYTDALVTELQAAARQVPAKLSSVFIGGGTPSLLPAPLLNQLLNAVHTHFELTPDVEFTSEANPGTLTSEWLDAAVTGGVNRLSMGMQAYQPELLRTLGRIHTHDDVLASVRLAHDHGIRNLNLDLMFGLPGQTPEMWRETLHAALDLQPEHLSCYGLIPEDSTPLKADLDAGRLTLPDEDEERQMYEDTLQILSHAGFLQYEISNFARPGYECRHNIGYWERVPYIGVGVSAASFLRGMNGGLRIANPADIPAYLHMVENGCWHVREITELTTEDERFESLMLGLRMTRGVSEGAFLRQHGITLEAYRGERLRAFEAQGLLAHENGCWRLTRRGMDVQNAILVELMDD